MELFGYQITKKIGSREEKLDKDLKSFVPKRDDEGSSSVVTTGGYTDSMLISTALVIIVRTN